MLLATVSVFGQRTVMSEKSVYYAKRYWTECKIGCTDDKYFILLNLFLEGKNVIEVGDKFQIMLGTEPITLTVTQEIFGKMDENGFLPFPLEKRTIELLSRNSNKFYLLRKGGKPLKFRIWDGNLKSLAMSVLEYRAIVKQTENGAVVKQTTEPGKRIYPSWRD